MNIGEKTGRAVLELQLKDILASLLGEQSNELNLDAPFSEIGVNSILAVEFVEALNLSFGTQLGVELIFDYNDIASLADYLRTIELGSALSEQQETILQVQRILGGLLQESSGELPNAQTSFGELGVNSVMGVEFVEEVNRKLKINLGFEVMYDYDNIELLTEHIIDTYGTPKSEPDPIDTPYCSSTDSFARDSDIAIIGLSGRFAGSDDIHEFWTHLQQGEDCIQAINRPGWEQESYYDSNPEQQNKSLSKWGGLLSEVDSFDPLFFHISPAEAERMDPQQRLFLEETYKAVEDSGYSSEQLSGKKVGVFVGGRSSDYKERTLEGEEVTSQTFLGNDMAILAARISYFMNFKGPSLAIDTACSSALVAVHLACESIRKEESVMAVAGGVFILSSPEFYVMTSKTNMLSPDGKCKTFDDSANGIVVGEGVGAVVLKSLKRAMAEGDHIYGVIKGSAINQDGKTKGITAPSMISQKSLLCEAYEKSDIDPGTISYIEAHGTGTKLGDPIEVKALSEAFSQFTDKKQYCAIGSHKPNFGHTIMSAGIAGMFKVLMAMKYRQIPPTIHVKHTNRHIDFTGSPFYLNTELIDWTPVEGYPLRAGISSFGFSGTNCHIILEEAPKVSRQKSETTGDAHLFPFSAKTKVVLKQKVVDMIEWLHRESKNYELADIAYTLQQGRSHFPFRLALVAQSTDELLERLKAIDELNGTNVEFEFMDASYAEVVDLQQLPPEQYIEMLNELAEQYSRQHNIEWERLHRNQSRYRVPLPGYPFTKQRFWAPSGSSSSIEMKSKAGTAALHPLIHQNNSTLYEQRYSSLFDGKEFFLKDHVVQGRRVLPGVAYLEMARAALQLATNKELGHTSFVLKNITWSIPFILEDTPTQLHVDLYPEETGDISYKVFSENNTSGEGIILHAQGAAASSKSTIYPKLDIEGLINQSESMLKSDECYESFRALGFAYGPSHMGIECFYKGKDYMVGKLVLPGSVIDKHEEFILHPSMMDAAFQLILAFNPDLTGNFESKDQVNPLLPFALNELEYLSSCTSSMWAYVRYSEGSQPGDRVEKMDILLYDEDGTLCVSIKELTCRRTNVVMGETTSSSTSEVMMYPAWREQPITTRDEGDMRRNSIIVLCELPDPVNEKVARLIAEDSECMVLKAGQQEIGQRFEDYAVHLFERLKAIFADRTPTFMQIVVPLHNEKQLFTAFSGLLKTAAIEMKGFAGQVIETDDWEDADGIVQVLKENSCCNDPIVRYQKGIRMVRSWKAANTVNEYNDMVWKDNGVYLITGGNGGLGRIFAKEIVSRCKSPTIVLVGKSPLSVHTKAEKEELAAFGAIVEYQQVDITHKAAVMELIRGIRETHGKLNGIIHGAGIIRDGLIMNKESDEFRSVAAPKVEGLTYLDEAASEGTLDFFVVFSSIAGIMGNMGQADYATANAFMDAYVAYRNGSNNLPIMLSINWPLWKDGGMQVDEAGSEYLFHQWGMKAMNTADGLEFFYRAMNTRKDQILVVTGDGVRFKQKLLSDTRKLNIRPQQASVLINSTASSISAGTNEDMNMKLRAAFIKLVSNLLKVDADDIDTETELTDYGFDSITFTQMTNQLNQLYNLDLAPTLFFEYPTIQQYVMFLISEYSNPLAPFFHMKAVAADVVVSQQNEETKVNLEQLRFKRENKRRFDIVNTETKQEFAQQDRGKDDIAVVGISGIFPMANDVEAFWENLVQGKDCISEIPKSRWDWRTYYGEPMTEPNKMNCRWGGFIEGIDEFDPLFFGISPKEAELMDPQQRLLMTYAWKAIEDAGYSAQSLSGTNTGIFAGTTSSGYNDLLQRANITIEGYSSTGMVPSVGPNRMSYFMNFHGPSEPIETACSSSLVAIHRAVRAIQSGDCDMAIAGGINTIISPELQISFSKAGMLCEDGRCKTFSSEANGYVRGEGVGMLLLKKLSEAEASGDHIYGVIRGTAENHGGRAASLTAPNPKAQTDLLLSAYRQAGIDPATVTYIETHGTGTSLGDPIEINGLKSAFKTLYQEAGAASAPARRCGLGSVKSNIGHLELAAGVAGVIKVLLQMKRKKLVKSLHCESLNPYIQLKDSPFYIVQDEEEWEALLDENGHAIPRRAGVSSFGFGGANAHVVIEEYAAPEPVNVIGAEQKLVVIVLSAKNAARLNEQACLLLEAIRRGAVAESDLDRVAYTLQVGREAMDVRLGFTAGSLQELEHKLQVYVEGKHEGADLYEGQARKNKEAMALIGADEDWQTVAQAWMDKGKYDKLLAFWSKGLFIDWNGLYQEKRPKRISLPTYPFAKERYWVPGEKVSLSLSRQLEQTPSVEHVSTVILLPHWQESPAGPNHSSNHDRHVIFLCEPDDIDCETFKSFMDSVSCHKLHSDQPNIFDRFQQYGLRILQELQSIIRQSPKEKVLIQVIVPTYGEQQLFTGLSGMLQTANLENPKLLCQLIELDDWPEGEYLANIVMESGNHPADQHVRYEKGRRSVKVWQAAESPQAVELPWENGGVYLITGGSGGLGMILAEEMAAKVPGAKLILTGKSAPRQNLMTRLNRWNESGFQIEYHQVDVTEKVETSRLIDYIRSNFGQLNGIIHGAGVINDSYILNKTAQQFTEVTAPKTKGLVLLDRLTADLNLDWFVLFSSISGVLGNEGQADYASANAFMDAFSSYRNHVVKAGQRFGRTISIAWPLWEEGGMQVDKQIKEHMKQKSGHHPLKTQHGIQALYKAFASDADHILVLEGEEVMMRNSKPALKLPDLAPAAEARNKDQSDQSRATVILRLKTIFATAAKLKVSQIDEDERFENYGIDSFMIAELNNKLGLWVDGLSKTIFYEYQTLGDLADYLLEAYPQTRQPVQEAKIVCDQLNGQIALTPQTQQQTQTQQPIAIIGISGRFPQSDNMQDYWSKLVEGHSCITEVPRERWDWREHYVSSKEEAVLSGKSCSKWGAFLAPIDEFDPKFFNMTPSEAEVIDPQERLFLEECWKSLEDAGYTPTTLSDDLRQRTGVFGGITKQGYNLLGSQVQRQIPSTSFSSMVNRVSYHLNIQGPSLPVDTMCSSSLVAIHEACEYIRQGKGDMALAGGVNLYVHPSGYAQLSKAQLISDSPAGNAFGRDGRGFVPGEGVGVVVLKVLDQAIKDGDHIHALIRGTAVNHSGRTNGYATPDPSRQAAVMQTALNQSGIDPSTITYIEAAASGSEMGDAIEMSAVTKAYGMRKDSEQRDKYSIGSVKPIVGHCEAASGMSQLAKVVLCLQNQTLVPTPIQGEINQNINVDTLPFRIQRRVEEWKRVSVAGVEVPRRAGVTSIGAGGVNAHIIVEEYLPVDMPNADLNEEPVLFVLSAKNRNRLEQYAEDWSVYLRRNPNVDLANLAYTLQVGREAMPCRLAFSARDQAQLEQQLERWLNNSKRDGQGDEGDNQIPQKSPVPDRELQAALKNRDLETIAQYWVDGHSIAWKELHQGKPRRKVGKLPTYPFARRVCWIGRSKPATGTKQSLEMRTQEAHYSNKAIEFYTHAARISSGQFTEDYLTFCPFEERLPGFSMSEMFLFPERNLEARQLMRSKQIELRQVLFCKEDFRRVRTFLDIGCGHGTDVIQVAALYPHLTAHGFTITKAQAELGNRRIEQKGLQDRATIFCKDSSKDVFPDKYDLAIGIEVSFHIRDKQGLFSNISASLNSGGRLLLMDYICNLKGAIVDPKVEISIPTGLEWVDILSEHRLVIDEIIDVSPEIANFLYDPFVEQNTAGFPEVTRDTYRNYANQSKSLEKGWISYCLFKLKKETQMSREECSVYNAKRLKNKTPYSDALREMLRNGKIPYPVSQPDADEQENSNNYSTYANDGQSKIRPVKEEIMLVFEEVLGIRRDELYDHETFAELGIGSVNAVQLTEGINIQFDLRLPTSIVFEYNSLKELAAYVEGQLPKLPSIYEPVPARPATVKAVSESQVVKGTHSSDHDIAIVGLSCRCAGAEGPDEFWDIVSQGKETVTELNNEAWKAFLSSSTTDKLVNRYGVMKNRDSFDSKFFRISPKEAGAIDVSQRILLEECYKALEDAGYTPDKLNGMQVGTIIGAMALAQPSESYSHFTMLGTDTSILAARIAYHLNLKGAAVAVNTACSSSLVAIDMACKQLNNGDIDMAVAGGITVYTHPGMFVSMQNAGMLSPTGQCRPFDQNADGIVVGDGAGVLILKRLEDAQVDGDHIYGVIRGSGTNQDGQTSGITVPSFQSQSQLHENVYRRYGIDVEDIQYIEAHGTATKLGDPIELHALTESFAKFTGKKQFCAIGSLKANIGHTTAAAGVLNVIKVLLSMRHEQMPPSIHFSQKNEHIDFDNSPVYVNTAITAWPVNTKGSRMAAVNSFGFSGTNAHVVIESYTPTARTEASTEEGVLPISAESKDGLHQYVKQLLDYLEKNERTSIKDLAYTFQVGRQSRTSRLAFEFTSRDMLISQLSHYVDGNGALATGGYEYEAGSNTAMLITDTEEGRDFVKRLASGGKFGKLAELWVRGNDIQWEALYAHDEIRKLGGLPTYPFAGQHFPLADPVLNNLESLPGKPPTLPVLDSNPPSRSADQQGISLTSLPAADVQQKQRNVLPKPQIVLMPTDHTMVRDNKQLEKLEESVSQDSSVLQELAEGLASALYVEQEEIDPDRKFVDLGLDSIIGVEWIQKINSKFGTSIPATKVYDYPTLREFSDYITSLVFNIPLGAESQAVKQENVCMKSDNGLDLLDRDLANSLADALYMNSSDIDRDMNFVNMGLDSIIGVEWIKEINTRYSTSIPATKVYDYPTLDQFTDYFRNELDKGGKVITVTETTQSMDEVLEQVYQGSIKAGYAQQILRNL